MVDADRVKSKIPSLLVEGSTNSKRGWRAFMRNRYHLKQFKKLEDVLARAKDMDEGIQEFRRLKDDVKAASNGNGHGKHVIAKGESELVQKLDAGPVQENTHAQAPLLGDRKVRVKTRLAVQNRRRAMPRSRPNAHGTTTS